MLNILIVDDDEAMRASLRRMLEGLGHEVSEACDGAEGLASFQRHANDLVFADLLMPEQDGFELIRALRKTLPDVKIVAMSGGGRISRGPYLEMAKQLGAQHTLQKPFSKDDLMTAINSALRE